MTFIPTPNTARAVVRFGIGAEEWSNVFHFTKNGFTEADMQSLADDIDDYVGNYWLASMSNGCGYIATDVYDIRTSTGPIVSANAESGPGTVSDEEESIGLAVVVTLRTATRGRTGRGRKYVAGFGAGNITDGSWTESTATDAKAFVDNVAATGVSAGWTHVIRCIQVDGVPLTEAVTRPVTSTEVRSLKPGTQRRRIDRP